METSSITVIITVWKRQYLAQQLESLIKQSLKPGYIWIIQNERHIDVRSVVERFQQDFPTIFIINSDFNLKYFGRFSLCSHVETEYTLIIDDDVIPSGDWLKICVEKLTQYNSIVSCTGRIIPKANYRPEEWKNEERKAYFIGDNQSDDECNFLPKDTRVDYGCNSYFFRTEWIKHFWSIWPTTFQSGEDIHLSATMMITSAISTIVPAQPTPELSGNLKKRYSLDPVSSWRDTEFINIRQKVFEFFIQEKKWNPILWEESVLKLASPVSFP